MPRSEREDKAPEARALYAAGATKAVIARSLDVARSTITHWSKQDADAGRPWERDAEPMQRGRLRALLEQRLADLAKQDDGTDAKAAAASEDRMLKICRVLDHLDDESDDLDSCFNAMERFGGFCVRNLSEADMDRVRRAITLFLDELRREHS